MGSKAHPRLCCPDIEGSSRTFSRGNRIICFAFFDSNPSLTAILHFSIASENMSTSDAAPLTGQHLAAAAYAPLTLKLRGLSLGIVVMSIFLAAVALLVACLRIWVRLGLLTSLTRIWKIEDYLLVLALVSPNITLDFAICHLKLERVLITT